MSENLENTMSPKEYFNHLALERINSGQWGLQQVEYLQQNRKEYNLDFNDINLYILHVYRYTYNMAMQDGYINEEEQDYLQHIKLLYNHHNPPRNAAAVAAIKTHITAIAKNFISNHNTDAIEEAERLRKEEQMRQEAANVYKKPVPRHPTPKLTPYSNFW